MSTPAENGSPQKAAIDNAVLAAYATEGYLTEDGKDTERVRAQMLEVLRDRKVLSFSEREDKAVTKGAMTEKVFPSLPGPADFGEQDDPQLAKAVWDKIAAALWTEARPSASGALQRLVGVSMGNGYVLCHTKIGNDQTPASYITDDRTCIERDFIDPDNKALKRKADSIVANRELLILRQPKNAKRWARNFDLAVKSLAAASHDQLALTVAAATSSPEDDEDADEG